jgi:ABC-2 type transport system permease protein
MQYRLNFLMQLFYGPAYVVVMSSVIHLMYQHTEHLVGWRLDETLLIFYIFQTMFTVGIVLFMGGIRHLLWEGISRGELDSVLVKPVNAQFMATFTWPDLSQSMLLLVMIGFLTRQLWLLPLSRDPVTVLAGVVSLLVIPVIMYLSVTTYATLGFYVDKVPQVIELYDKLCDNSMFPAPFFPRSLQALAFSVVPVAFFGYLPAGMLLGKLSPWWAMASLVILAVLWVVNQWAWDRALKAYTSASS